MHKLFFLFLINSCIPQAEARRKKAGESSKNTESPAEMQDQLADIEKALSKKKPKEAARLLSELLSDQNNRALFPQAYELQLRTWEQLKLPFTRFQFFPTILKEKHKENKQREYLEEFVDLAEELGEESLLPELILDQSKLLKPQDQDLLIYHQAKNALRKSNFSLSLELAKSLSKDSKYYPKALNIEAVTLSQQNRFNEAVIAFQRALGQLKSSNDNPKLLDIVQLNLARNYYAMGIFSAAIEGFDAVPRRSPYWLEAQFEKAWALFRQQQINPMLSILQTHTTEFFVDGVYPEEEMLRIYGFFLLCKFESTSQAVDIFEERYTEHLITLREWTQKSDEDLFRGFSNHRNGGLPKMLSRHFEFEDQMNEAVFTVQALDKEIKILENLGNFTAPQIALLETRRDQIITEQGARIKAKGTWKIQQIDGMLQNMKITRLDITEIKQRILNKEAALGERLGTKRQAIRRIKKKPGHHSWLYQGEQWADELGYYEIKVKSDCPSEF